jgi:DNA polymerase-3 subunit alpha
MYVSGHPLQAFQLEMENFCTPIVELARDVEAKDIVGGPDRFIAGLVTTLAHKTTKRGAPFLTFQVEDFSASIELALFNDDYLNHQAKVIKGAPIWLHGQLAKRYNNEELELRIKDIRSLDHLRASKTHAITLFPTANQATGRLGELLRTILTTHAGPKPVRIEIQMPDGPPLKLVSRSFRVEVSDDLIDDLRLLDIPFSLNGVMPKTLTTEAVGVEEEMLVE